MKPTVVRSIKSQQKLSRQIIAEGKTIAIVPTMGFLHDGHLSLIKKAQAKADVVITTIFVNPAQFAPHEDFNRYPRDTKSDLKKIASVGCAGVRQIVFMPRAEDIYPPGFQSWVVVEGLTQSLEAASRPTHFRGVTTIVGKLFNIVQPDYAIFGMKDYQQAMVLKKMTSDLNWPIKFIIAPTVREPDGLAMSSRNKYLSIAHRAEATALIKSLRQARKLVRAGEKSSAVIRREIKKVIIKSAPSGMIDYIALTSMDSLKPVRIIEGKTVASLAVKFGAVRLIDNILLG